ncbi:MAG: AlpA family transcriptional regulator [Halofilum sp. (in: g-proteobacteria)]|nr:AlpA family transcriptional regulator [Halofilum sp. (in: g-proteobacteria)]
MSELVLRCREVEQRVGLSCSTLYYWIQRGEFPAPVRLGPRAVGWRESDIDRWISERAEAGAA